MMANKKRLVAITLAILMLVMECVSLFSCGKKVENFELSFNVDGENYATITTTGTETIQIPENPSKDGYTFDGWYWDKDVWSKPFTANSLLDAPISSDMSVYAKFTPIAYSISYEMDGGTHNNPATYTIESSFEFADAQKAGYTFLGWYTDAAYTTQIKSISAGTTGDMTLYAKFELATYSITYENTKDAENTNPTTYTTNSETITFLPLSKDGYTFDGWYVGDIKVMEISKGSTGNLTLTAKWDTIGYSITYHNVDGATHTNPAFYDVEDQPLTLFAASKTGYRFVGWYTDEALTNKVTEIAVGTTGDLDLYAKWEIIEYTATFKDGDTVVGTVKFTVESDFITEPAVPEHTGYTGAWESYTLGAEDITIDAIYTLITYNIVYHNVDGANNTNPSNYDVEDQPLALLDASKDYYTFKGWYTDAEFNDKVTEIAVGTTGVVNLYAKWEAIEYTATFKDGDTVVGTVNFTVETNSITEPTVPEHTGYIGVWESYTLGTEDITVNAVYTLITYGIVYHNVVGATNTNPTNYDVEDQPLALLDASKDYYTFKGWYTDAEFNNKVTEIAVGTTGVVNLYAKWEAVEYTATFMDGDTEVGKVKFTVETESIMPPAVPEHIGYTGAWESYTLGHENITVNAVYTPITYTITYTETKGATNSNVGTYTIESETIILDDLSAIGYTFDGWYNGDTKVTQIPSGSIGNLTLTAKWTAIKYSITYLYDHEIGDYADENKNPTTYTIEDEFVFIPLVNHTPGYTFDGWFTEKNNGTGTKVTGVALGTTGDITVYAQWGLENYTITYHNVNGATNTNAENYNVETETFSIENIARIGYIFDGWYADAEFTTPANTTIVKGSTGNIDMYAKWTPIGYSITYILFWDTVDDITNPDRYTIEDSFVLNNPTREGYVFVGWYTLNENGERVIEIKENSTGNKTFYARWIKFESNGGSAVSYTPIHSGNTISAPVDPTRTHYEFDGWYTNEELTQKYNFKPTKSITLYAKWAPVEYEIEYILNGGTNSKDNPDTYTVEDKFELCASDKVGYTFVGWFTDPEFTSTVVTEIKAGTSGKITLYAHYLINQYTISFESNGGTTVSAITQNYATDVTAPEAPAKNGYNFAGWYTDAALTKAYTFTTMPAEDITLYAKWNIVTYDITYNLDGGTNHRNNPSTYKITSADITLGTPTKTGYTFGGWYTDSACTQSITKIANGSFGDVELFAKWTATVYTVTYNMPIGATQSNAATYTIETNLITLTNATLKGHTFNGWYSDSTYAIPVTTIAGGAIGDVVLYAKFTANIYNVWLEGDEEAKHTVSFDLNGAEGKVTDQTVTPTATLKYPTIPTRDEYIFAGWYDNAACTGAPYDFTAVVTKDTTLYAKWVKIENASLIAINGSANVTLNGKTEHMLVFVPLVSGNITITSSGEYDTFGTLYNAEMVALIQNDDGAADGINFHIVYNVTAGETYYIGARAFSSTTTGSATVSISGDTTVLDGGYAITTSQTPITYGTSFTLTLPDARDGYKFLGYADANGVMYTNANGNSIKNWDKDEDTILYSVWERTVYTVTFETSGGTPIDTITLAYGDRFDISKYVTTREGYTFNGWYLDGEEYNATTMPDHSITLTAYWKTFALGTIKYDTDKKAISVNDTITPELFDALCLDTNGKLATFTVSMSGTQAAGETITVRLTATSGGKTKVVTITDIKVYGAPTLSFDDTVDYVNINGGMTASHFGASGQDTFGAATEIKVYIDGDYEVGTLVKIVIESIDPAGNITYGYIENVKAYGLPEITYNENKTAISINDMLNAELFGATAKDSFGEALAVTASKVSGTISAGNTVTLRISATDSKGNVTNIDIQCKVYGAPTISDATKTDVRADDTVTPDLLGIIGTDTYGENLTVTLVTKDGAQTAGTVWTVTATVIDAAGNVTTKDFELKVYGTPTISYDKEAIKITEDATVPASVTVTFNLNGGNGSITSQIITSTEGLVYPTIPTRSGYVFKGWYTSADCTMMFDFGANLIQDTTVYAGWHQITTSGYGNYVMNVMDDNNSSSDYYTISTSGTSSENAKYTYFTILTDGTYKLYYKNGSSNTNYKTYLYVYNATQGTTITNNTDISSTSYSCISFTAKAGDVICVRNYRYSTSSSSYYTTFYMYLVGVSTPTAGGVSEAMEATTILNIVTADSFGNPLKIIATVKSGSLTAGTNIVYTLTTTDHLGNTYNIDTKPIGVYDEKDINLTYSAGMSDLIKLTSKGEEFDAKATDSFGNLCDITIEAAEGYTYKGGQIITLYIVATDKAGNRILSEAIEEIKVYDTPTITLNQDNRVISESTDINFLFTVRDSFGEELYANATSEGEQKEGNTIIVMVTATDDAGNTVHRQYSFGVLPCEKPFVELYVDGKLWKILFVESKDNYILPLPIWEDGLESLGWIDENGNRFSDSNGVGLLTLPNSIQLYCEAYPMGFTPIYTVEQLKKVSLDKNYALIMDLDLEGAEWTPIGYYKNFQGYVGYSAFKGVFDGNGHIISNFKIVNHYSTGFFGKNNGTIKNLGVADVSIYSTGSSIYYAGGLAGYNVGDISNCYAIGNVSITYETSASMSSSRYIYAGGLIGYNNAGTITNSFAEGSVSVTSTARFASAYVGGLVGRNEAGIIMNCYAAGEVSSSCSASYSNSNTPEDFYTGGLIGHNKEGNITNCYATSKVDVTCAYWPHSGGLVGHNDTGTIKKCYAMGDVSTNSPNYSSYYGRTGGLVGYNSYGSLTDCYVIGNIVSKGFVDNYADYLVSGNFGSITNCYHYDGQTISGKTTNTLGVEKSLIDLQSMIFNQSVLRWNPEIWNFVDGEYPTLKNVGTIS